MGTRTGVRGNDPQIYTDEGLRTEIARVEMRTALKTMFRAERCSALGSHWNTVLAPCSGSLPS